jgi:iron complex transport system permease protein
MKARPFLIALFFLVLALVLSIAIGSVLIPPSDLARLLALWLKGAPLTEPLSTYAFILSEIRLPHAALVLLTGAALGCSGAAYQGVFRNPLADPYLIGVASGAGLGAVLAMNLNWPYSFWGLLAVPLSAFLFSLLTVALVYALARIGKTLPITNLILAGVAFGSFATAITTFLMLRSTGELHRAVAWLSGGAAQAGWQPVLAMLPFLLPALGFLLLSGHALNLLQFGDDQAQQLGLPVTRTRALILLAASLATAAAVSFAGIIGFLGLIIPHLIRMWSGADYRRLVPLSLLAGAGALLVADLVARSVLAPQELPVGVVTALVGAPFFLWVLRRTKNQGFW